MNWYHETRKHYDSTSEKPAESFYPGRLRKRNILKILQGKMFGASIDVGCGTGRYTKVVKEVSKNVVGCDFSESRLKKVSAPVCMADCEHLPFKTGSADFVLCSEVLQHVRPEGIINCVKEIKRVLKKRGIILLIAKNGENPFRSKISNPINWMKREDLKNYFKEFEVKFYGDRLLPNLPAASVPKIISAPIEIFDTKASSRLIKFCDSIIMYGERK